MATIQAYPFAVSCLAPVENGAKPNAHAPWHIFLMYIILSTKNKCQPILSQPLRLGHSVAFFPTLNRCLLWTDSKHSSQKSWRFCASFSADRFLFRVKMYAYLCADIEHRFTSQWIWKETTPAKAQYETKPYRQERCAPFISQTPGWVVHGGHSSTLLHTWASSSA